MKERPILFDSKRIQALLLGTQTWTRRIMKSRPLAPPGQDNYEECYGIDVLDNHYQGSRMSEMSNINQFCPYGQPADRLWVREAWRGPIISSSELVAYQETPHIFRQPHYCQYRADSCQLVKEKEPLEYSWQSAIYMPRWASQICLEIIEISVRKIQDINEDDIMAEGINLQPHFLNNYLTVHSESQSPRESYRKQWTMQYGATSWEVNPWVWVINFRRI